MTRGQTCTSATLGVWARLGDSHPRAVSKYGSTVERNRTATGDAWSESSNRLRPACILRVRIRTAPLIGEREHRAPGLTGDEAHR